MKPNIFIDYLWYPFFVGFAIVLFAALLSMNMPLPVALYTPIVITGLFIVGFEAAFPARRDWRPKWSDIKADAAFMATIQIILPRLLMVLIALAVAVQTHAGVGEGALWPHTWPLAAQAMLMVLIVDFMRYWLHRACHHFNFLWKLHEVHHSPDILYTLNVARFHPLEKILHFSLDTVPFLLLGVAPQVLAAYFLLYSVNGFFQHSNARVRYGWLNYVVGSAETHRWHHAKDPNTAACNFGNTTIIWDILFGTWYLPENCQVDEIGIMDGTYPKGFLAQMLTPFRHRNDDGAR